MALTLTRRENSVVGNFRLWIGNAAFDSSYAANGETLSPGAVGMSTIDFVDIAPVDETSMLRLYGFDYTNNKLLVIEPTQQTAGAGNRAGVEVADTTDLATSQHTVRLKVWGR